MKKPTYYLIRDCFETEEDYLREKESYTKCGFRVVTFFSGPPEKSVHDVLKEIIKYRIQYPND